MATARLAAPPLTVMARRDPTRFTHLEFSSFVNELRSIFRFESAWIFLAFVLPMTVEGLAYPSDRTTPFRGRMRCVHLVGRDRAISSLIVLMPMAPSRRALTTI